MSKNKPWFDIFCNLAFKKKCKSYKLYAQNPNTESENKYEQHSKQYKI